MEEKKKILLVEDDVFLQDLYKETLLSDGLLVLVETASTGEEAMLKILQGGWDLVLLDIILPKMDGLEIMRRIKASPPAEKPSKKIIFLTNLDNDDQIKEALKLGDGYLIKSQLTPGDFLIEVKNYLKS